jgi:hypothetical protein
MTDQSRTAAPCWSRIESSLRPSAERAEPPASLPNLLTTAQVAALFGASVKTIGRWRKAGILASAKLSGTVFFDADDVRALIAQKLAASIHGQPIAAQMNEQNASQSPEGEQH